MLNIPKIPERHKGQIQAVFALFTWCVNRTAEVAVMTFALVGFFAWASDSSTILVNDNILREAFHLSVSVLIFVYGLRLFLFPHRTTILDRVRYLWAGK